MGTGYTRNDTADNIADGNIINASDLDGEFDALQSAFDNSTGHTHDGTAGEGAPIEKVGPNQEVVVTSNVLRPAANNTIDLGVQTTNEFKDLWLDGTAYLDSVDIDGGTIDGLSVLTVDNLSLNGNTITSTDTNGNLNLRANGDGIISVDATDVNFGDSDKATFGDGSDLQIYHDGSHSYIDDVGGTGNIKIRATNLVLQSAISEDYATFIANGAATLFYDNAAKIATTATGISVTGDVQASDDLILASDSSKITFGADGDVEITHSHNVGLIFDNTNTSDNQDFVLTLRSNEDTITADEQIARINFSTNSSAGGQAAGTQASIKVDATDTYSATVAGSRMEFHTTTGSGTNTRAMYIDDDQSVVFTGPSANVKLDATNNTLDFPDNFKIMMGTGDDLQIYHDGANSYIDEAGTGNLRIRASSALNLQTRNAADTAWVNSIIADDGAGVRLFTNGSKKLETTSTGIDVTGTVTADGLTVDGVVEVNTVRPQIFLYENDRVGNNTRLETSFDNFNIAQVDDTNSSPVNRMTVEMDTGNISFYEDTGTTAKFFWDASAESLGIGTTSFPNAQNKLTIQGNAGASGAGVNVAADEFFIDNNGDTGVTIGSANTGTGYYAFADSDVALRGGIFYDHSTDDMGFRVASGTRMTIDSSGHLLVGTTDNAVWNDTSGTGGINLRSDGILAAARNGGEPLLLNRLGTDGELIKFKKNGSIDVGSIVTSSGLVGLNNGNTALTVDDSTNSIHTRLTNGTLRDGSTSLGKSDSRFKDLYLSEGIYLGGTGAANKLTDYETGTWTPIFADASTGGNTDEPSAGKRGQYTKIGQQVTITLSASNLRTVGMTATNDFYIRGLPFTPISQSSPNQVYSGVVRCSSITFSTNGFLTAYLLDNQTHFRLLEIISGLSSDSIRVTEVSDNVADLDVTITYFTNG